MLFSRDQKTEDLIISRLSEGPILSQKLIDEVIKEEGISFQGVYKALAKLKSQEVIVKHKQTISLNIPWVHRLTRFTESAIRSYSIKNYNLFLDFKEGQRTTLVFTDFTSMDAYWIHMMISLAQEYEESIFLYNSHDWYVLARPDLKSEFFLWIDKYKRPSFMLIGHEATLDRQAVKDHSSTYLQLAAVEKPMFNEWSYITIIGDFVIETRCEKQTAGDINRLYEKYPIFNEAMMEELNAIISRKQKWKIIITRKKEKAHKIRKSISKYFYIPKEIRGKV